ncbi:MAG: hypothetical protein RIC55_29795 [Pirellulaceae bacterium]
MMIGKRSPSLLLFALLLSLASVAAAQVRQAVVEDVELFSLVLISVDLERATTTMRLFDKDGDAQLDAREMAALPWSVEPVRFDVDRNGRIAHVEAALYLAFRRFQAGIEERDEVFSKRMMGRYDRNQNLVLEPVEIRDGHWPDDPEGFDADQDGRLTQFEITAGLARERRERTEKGVTGLDNGQAIWFVRVYDHDKDRRLDRDEYEQSLEKMSPLEWRDADANRDELVTTTELAFAMAARRQEHGIAMLDQQVAYGNMTRVDRNKDRELDEREILRGRWPEFPDQYDADKNMRLTRFELEARIAEERRKRGVAPEDEEQAQAQILRYDKNGNLQIEAYEVEGRPPGDPQDIVTIDVFVSYDLDFDQRLTRKELAVLFAQQREQQGKK